MYIHYIYPLFHTSSMSVAFTLIYYIQYMYIHYTVHTYIPLYDGFPDVSPLEGRCGGWWKVTWAAVPHLDGCLGACCTASLLHGVVFIFAIFPNKSTRTMKCQKMLCNGFPGRREGYYTLLHMITSCLLGKLLHSIFSVCGSCRFVWKNGKNKDYTTQKWSSTMTCTKTSIYVGHSCSCNFSLTPTPSF